MIAFFPLCLLILVMLATVFSAVCFRSDPTLQELIYKLVPDLYIRKFVFMRFPSTLRYLVHERPVMRFSRSEILHRGETWFLFTWRAWRIGP